MNRERFEDSKFAIQQQQPLVTASTNIPRKEVVKMIENKKMALSTLADIYEEKQKFASGATEEQEQTGRLSFRKKQRNDDVLDGNEGNDCEDENKQNESNQDISFFNSSKREWKFKPKENPKYQELIGGLMNEFISKHNQNYPTVVKLYRPKYKIICRFKRLFTENKDKYIFFQNK